MNQQNMMQQYFEQQQQANVNGYPGAGFPPAQQPPGSFGSVPTPTSNPYIGNAPSRQQNGVTENFDMNSQGYPNFMDPRMAGFDPRNRPGFDPSVMMPGMDAYGANSNFSGKIRMNEMAAMFNNPAAMAAFQRQRMAMFNNHGREGEFMSPTNPYAPFNPQAAQLMQQQRMAAFHRQIQMASQQNTIRPGSTVITTSTPSSTVDTTVDQSSQNLSPGNFTQQHNRQSSLAGSDVSTTDAKSPQVSTTNPVNIGTTQSVDVQSKLPNENGRSTPGAPDQQRNAAMVAAAAVRAAAAAQQRNLTARGGFPMVNPGMNSFPFGPRFGITNEQIPSPVNKNLQPQDLANVMSPSKDPHTINAASPLSQGRATPRSGNPPPYSPLTHSSDSNHSASGSTKGSTSNLANVEKNEGNASNTNSVDNQNSYDQENVAANSPSEQSGLMIAGGATKLSAAATPISINTSSPAPFQDDTDSFNMSPSWPQTPQSPNTQKALKARASPKQYEQLSKVYDLIDDAEKKQFFERYLAFMSVHGTPVTKLPIVGSGPLDLYALFRAVCERGGIQEVMSKRLFREVLTTLNLPSGNSGLSYLVKSQYMKYLQTYEEKNKDVWMNQWKLSTNKAPAKSSAVPTIALNETLQSQANMVKSNKPTDTFIMTSSNTSNWMHNSFSSSSVPNSSSTNTSVHGGNGHFGPRMSYGQAGNQALPPYGQQGLPPYGQQEMPPGYPGFGAFQNPMFPRGPMQNFNTMRHGMPNDAMPGGWPRGFSPRQGPPELFPEGLQRMPYNHAQRHPLSAFGNNNFAGKPRGQMPPISRDQMEQMKYNAQQQQQIKLQLQHQQNQMHQKQQQQQQQQQPNPIQPTPSTPVPPQRFNVPHPPGKHHHRHSQHRHHADNKPQPPHAHHNLKRELVFPPNSIESTKPLLKKRKKLTSKDLGPVEAWRIMMSLKSGLVAECTWAIDTLNILLADNSTITYFHLNQLPGLLDTLMDHYRRSLANLFGTFDDLEIPLVEKDEKDKTTGKSVEQVINELWVGVCKNSKGSWSSNIASTAVADSIKKDTCDAKDFWKLGGGDNTTHIRTSFPNKDVTLKAFPKGITYITEAEEERERRLTACHSTEVSANSHGCKTDSNSSSIKKESDTSSPRKPDACIAVLSHLMKECEKQNSNEETHPLLEKLLKDLEFNVSYDMKYLEDSKDFIEYLNRRLHRENRGNVESEQCIVKQNTPFVGTPESEMSLLNRCVALSNIFRSLSFIQGNDAELAGHVGLLLVCAHVLLHKHQHAVTDHSQFKLGLDERVLTNNAIADEKSKFWWDSVFAIRENMLVMLANVGGYLNLVNVKNEVRQPLVEGLLHWLTCRSSEALDPMPTAPGNHSLSAQRLSMETLAKMTINTSNIDIVMSYTKEKQLQSITQVLVKLMARKSSVPTREFAIILLDNLARSDQFSKVLAMCKSSITNLIKFVHEAEKNTSSYLSSGGRVQPGLNAEDICGTSISLLRRSVNIILSIAKVPSNRRKLTPFTDDILALSTSQMIDTSVLALLAQVLFELTL